MRSRQEIIDQKKMIGYVAAADGGMCFIQYPGKKDRMQVVFTWGLDWDHVSVSYNNKIPSWEDMCFIKGIFFHEEETVVQYHPAKEDYVNCHPFVLHLWKPQTLIIPKPDKKLVGGG